MNKILLLLAAFLLSTPASYGQKKRKKRKPKNTITAPSSQKSKLKSIASITKNCVKHDGFLTIYTDTTTGKAYLEIEEGMLNQQMIYFTYAENGLVNLGLFRGSYRETSVVKFEKVYNNIHVKKIKTGLYFNPDNNLSKTSKVNISDAIASSEQILGKTKNRYLINATNLLGTETLHQLARNIPRGFPFPFITGRINSKKTFVKNVRNYPENTDVIYSYTFDNGSSYINDGTVADPRYITVEVQHSFVQMPDSNFVPRKDDPRVGYFTSSGSDMTTTKSLNYRDFINHWRLEKKDPSATLSEPVKPITWWIENTTPKELIPIIKRAGEAWNLAFEPLGFKNAVVMKVQPDTAEWDAGDIRYNVLRWASSVNPRFGGYGPSFANPLTGEILGADIMLEWVFLTNRINSKLIFEPNSSKNMAEEKLHHNHECSLGHHLQMENIFGHAATKALNIESTLNQDGTIKLTPLLEQGIFYLILHEMGHTFGLNHNMKASQLHSPEDLNNKELTNRVGLVGSVMDYPAINFAPLGKEQGQYYTTRPGPYDLWAINYAYSVPLADGKAENERLNQILAQSHKPELTFGNDADDMRSPGKGIDPRVMIGDLSSDALTYAEDRMELCQHLIDNALNSYVDYAESYADLRKAVGVLVGQYAIQAGVISRYIGGVYVDRSFAGQTEGSTPYTPTPIATQKKAMKLLTEKVFSSVPIVMTDTLIAHLQPQRRGFGFFARPEDPKTTRTILGMQSSVLNHILSASVLNRLIDSELYGNDYKITDMMKDLTDAIFNKDAFGTVNFYRQNLQIDYVNRLIGLAGLSGSSNTLQRLRSGSYSSIAKARAYAQIKGIQKLISSGRNSGDEGSKQHKAYILQLIDKALE